MDVRSRQLVVRIFIAVAGAAALAAVVAGVALFSMAQSADRAELAYEQGLVSRGFTYRIEEVEKELFPHVIWDEALINVDNRFDATWVRNNVGLPLTIGYGHHAVIILSGSGRPVYANLAKKDVEPDVYRKYQKAASSLVAKVRRAERQALRTGSLAPNHASVAALVEGVPMLITASLFQQDFRARPLGPTAPILVTALPVRSRIAPHFSRRYALTDVQAIIGDPASGTASAALPTDKGSRPIRLQWQPRRPGSDLLFYALPPLAAALVLVGVAAFFLFSITRRSVERVLASEAEARHMARHDALTGVGNRILFAERYEQERLAAADGQRQFAVLVFDLDHFKAINDVHGHNVGDAVICAVAQALAAAASPADTVVRLGGDEFAVIAVDVDQTQLAAYCEKALRLAIGEVTTPAGPIHASCTIGGALLDPSSSMSEALRSADLALYFAKRAGRGRYALYSPMLEAVGEGRIEQRGWPPARAMGEPEYVGDVVATSNYAGQLRAS